MWQAILDVTKKKQVRVVAAEVTKPFMIWSPPCVPKPSRILDTTENTNAVRIDVVTLRTAVTAANTPDGHILRSMSFYVG